jgi:hypothetical protein
VRGLAAELGRARPVDPSAQSYLPGLQAELVVHNVLLPIDFAPEHLEVFVGPRRWVDELPKRD